MNKLKSSRYWQNKCCKICHIYCIYHSYLQRFHAIDTNWSLGWPVSELRKCMGMVFCSKNILKTWSDDLTCQLLPLLWVFIMSSKHPRFNQAMVCSLLLSGNRLLLDRTLKTSKGVRIFNTQLHRFESKIGVVRSLRKL